MKAKTTGKLTMASIVAVAVALIPLAVYADGLAQTDAQKDAEIASLKRQIYQCRHHKRRHHRAASYTLNKTTESKTVIEKPVVVEKEKVIEKQVVVEKPGEVILEKPAETEQKVVVQHAPHHMKLIHIGIPFIGLDLF